MQSLTLQKMFLIALVIGLGVALGSLVPISKATGSLWKMGPMSARSSSDVRERTPFPVVVLDRSFHLAWRLEFDN